MAKHKELGKVGNTYPAAQQYSELPGITDATRICSATVTSDSLTSTGEEEN